MIRLMLAIASVFATPLLHGSFPGPTASAQVLGGNRYGIVTIHNTIGSIINYSYRIGNGDWHQASIKPGHYRYYYHTYDFANENRSPLFRIRFDSDMEAGVARRELTLRRNPAPWVNAEFGRHYDFKYLAGNQINIYHR